MNTMIQEIFTWDRNYDSQELDPNVDVMRSQIYSGRHPVDISEGFQPFSWSVTPGPASGDLEIYSPDGLITAPTLPTTIIFKMLKIRTSLLVIKDIDIMFTIQALFFPPPFG